MGNELTHYGVKGMRWGVRRSKAQLARSRKKQGGSDAYKYTDDELRKKVARMNLERQYSQMTKKEASAAKKFVTKALGTAAATIATAYITKYMRQGADYVEGNLKSHMKTMREFMDRKAEEEIAARLAGLKR